MRKEEEIIRLFRELLRRFDREMGKPAGDKLSALTEEEKDTLYRLLQKLSCHGAGQHAYGAAPGWEPEQPERGILREGRVMPSAPKKKHPLPDPNTYIPLGEDSAMCQGCPNGCEVHWDKTGKLWGFSCPNGEDLGHNLYLCSLDS